MEIIKLTVRRRRKAKRAFTTRRVVVRDMRSLICGDVKPRTGDLVLATVQELGKHKRLEHVNGRRAVMMPGDEIIVSYGNRYAPDQFEALVSEDLSLCDLVASGGIAACEISRHDRILPPTQIRPIGLIGNSEGKPLNLASYRLDSDQEQQSTRSIKVVLVVGTAMNSGKTFTASSVIRSLKDSNYRVAGIKATGTGSGADLWKMKDMGADVIMDFTDVGFASTYKIPDQEIERGLLSLVNQAIKRKCDFAVVEIADGLLHLETSNLLCSDKLQALVSSTIFTAYDSMGAKAGYLELTGLGYKVIAISGQLTRSPLAIREANFALAPCPVYTPFEIQAGALVQKFIGETDQKVIEKYDILVKQKLATNFGVDFAPHQSDILKPCFADRDASYVDFPMEHDGVA